MRYLLPILLMLCAGCGTIQTPIEFPPWMKLVLDNPADIKEKNNWQDELEAPIEWHGYDLSQYEITDDESAKQAGASVIFSKPLPAAWEVITGVDNDGNKYVIQGTCFMVRRVGSKWVGTYFDHMRPGQTKRGFPLNPPHPIAGHGDYPTVTQVEIDTAGVYVCRAMYQGIKGKKRTKLTRLR